MWNKCPRLTFEISGCFQLFEIKITLREKHSRMKTSKSVVHSSLPTASGFQITCYDHPSQPGLQAGRE